MLVFIGGASLNCLFFSNGAGAGETGFQQVICRSTNIYGYQKIFIAIADGRTACLPGPINSLFLPFGRLLRLCYKLERPKKKMRGTLSIGTISLSKS